jgi:hypothetical protein
MGGDMEAILADLPFFFACRSPIQPVQNGLSCFVSRFFWIRIFAWPPIVTQSHEIEPGTLDSHMGSLDLARL